MMSVSASEQVKFKSKKCGTITLLPVTVEFGKFVGNNGGNNRQKRNINTNNKVNRTSGDYLSAPSELLHAVVALYHTYLPGCSLDLLYKTICREGSRTLLLLRDGSEILDDWKRNGYPKGDCCKNDEEINNNKLRGGGEEKTRDHRISSTDKNHQQTTNESPFEVKQCETDDNEDQINCTSNLSPDSMITHEILESSITTANNTTTSPNDEGIDSSSVISGDGYQSDNWSSVSSIRQQRISSFADIFSNKNNNHNNNGKYIYNFDGISHYNDNNNANINVNNNGFKRRDVFRSSLSSLSTSRRKSETKEIHMYNHTLHAIADVFADIDDDLDQESMEEEEEDDSEDFERGMQVFLRAVANRRNLLFDANNIGDNNNTLTEIGIESRLIGCATFYKNYRVPGVKVVCIPFITVRKRYRKCGIGKFLIKRLKRCSQVGSYDALVAHTHTNTVHFFRANGFTDDIILNSRFRESMLDEEGNDALPRHLSCGPIEQMCYLPPFDGHFPPMPGTDEWNRAEVMSAIEDEVDTWRQKSLEAYQSQWTCVARLQQEVVKLRSLLKRQEYGIHQLRKENLNLQKMLLQSETESTYALIDAWKKETANYG